MLFWMTLREHISNNIKTFHETEEISEDVEISELKGFLVKTKKLKKGTKCQRRWFHWKRHWDNSELTHQWLYYFQNKKSSKPKGSFKIFNSTKFVHFT